jgi:hypothetical protein
MHKLMKPMTPIKQNRLALELLESRVCMSVAIDAVPIQTHVGTVLTQQGPPRLVQMVNTISETVYYSIGSGTVTLNGSSFATGWQTTDGTLVLHTYTGQTASIDPRQRSSSSSSSSSKSSSNSSRTAPAAAPAAAGDSSADVEQPTIAIPNLHGGRLSDADGSEWENQEKKTLASAVDAAVQGNDSASTAPTTSFIPSATSASDSSFSNLSSRALADRALERLSRLAPMEAPFAASAEPIRATEFLEPVAKEALIDGIVITPASQRPAFADGAVSFVAHTAVSAAMSNPAMPSARYFGFTPMGMPAALASDSIAAFAEESASISAGVAVQARAVVFPWAFTFSVIAADIVLLSYIHRRALRQRLAATVHWPPPPDLALVPAA